MLSFSKQVGLRAQDERGGPFYLWNSSGLFCVAGLTDPQGTQGTAQGSFVCSGFPLKGKTLVFVLS